MLLWCVKSENLLNEWNMISKCDLAFRIQECLELNLSGILLRSQNQLRDKFQQQDWLYDSLQDMSSAEKDFSFLHNTFVFEKVENAPDKVYKKLKNLEEKIRKKEKKLKIMDKNKDSKIKIIIRKNKN